MHFQGEKERQQENCALVSLFEEGRKQGVLGRGGGPRARPLPFRLPRTLLLPSPCGPRVGEETLPPRHEPGVRLSCGPHEPPRAPPAYRHVLACPPPLRRQGKGLAAAYSLPLTAAFPYHGPCIACLSCGSGVQTVTVTRSFRLRCCQGGRSLAEPSRTALFPVQAGLALHRSPGCRTAPGAREGEHPSPPGQPPAPCPALPSRTWTPAPACLSLGLSATMPACQSRDKGRQVLPVG